MRSSASTLLLALTLTSKPSLGQKITIERQPSTSIGRSTNSDATLNGVVGAWRLRSGEIVVLEQGGASPLRVFKANGEVSRVVARAGAGPGELGPTLFAASRAGDSIVTYEIAGARASVFDLARKTNATNTVTFRNSPGRPVVQGVLAGSQWLVVGAPGALRAHDDGAFRDTAWFGVAGVKSDSLVLLGSSPRAAFYANNKVPGPPNLQRIRYDSLVPWGTIVAHAGRILVADPASPTIRILDARGAQVASITVPFEATGYAPRELERARAKVLATSRSAADSGMKSAMYELTDRPKVAPRFKRVVPGPNGEIWVEKFWLDEATAREFAVFDTSGRLVGRVTGAPAVRFTEFGADYAIGIAVDADGAQEVQIYRLTRS